MPRYAIVVQVKTRDDVYLTDRQQTKISQTLHTLTSAAFTEIDGADVDLRAKPDIAYMHVHDSTQNYACVECMNIAQDCQNSET